MSSKLGHWNPDDQGDPMFSFPSVNRAALASAGRFVLFAAAGAALTAAATALPGLHLGEPYATLAGFAIAAALKYVEAHRRVTA